MAKDRIDRNELADSWSKPPRRRTITAGDGGDYRNGSGGHTEDRGRTARAERGTGRIPQRPPRSTVGHAVGHAEPEKSEVREGEYVPSFIEHRKRSQQALISIIQ
jgi:hypothetical protein